MAFITATSTPGRVPVTDRRSAGARFLKRVRAALIDQCGGNPSASQRLIIDSVASLSLRIRVLECDPSEYAGREYPDAPRLLADLLVQLGLQAATPAVGR